MPNWTSLTPEDVAKAGSPDILAAAEAKAAGSTVEMIADAVSAVRGAVSTGNALDVDATKVPNSLKALTARIAFYSLMTDVLVMELTVDQRKSRDMDASRLNRITDEKLRFEVPDNSGGSAEMQQSGGTQIFNMQRRQTGRGRQSGL